MDKKYINTHQHFVHKIMKDRRVVRYTVTQTWRQEQSLINKLNYTIISTGSTRKSQITVCIAKSVIMYIICKISENFNGKTTHILSYSRNNKNFYILVKFLRPFFT